MKNKAFIILLSILLILSICCGIIGYLNKEDDNNNNIVNKNEEKLINYEYYLENEKVDELPIASNESEIKYVLSEYKCTNGITGEYDSINNKFVPEKEIEGTCSLYFVKDKYEVSFTVVNGITSLENEKYLDRDKDGLFTIIPNEGYQYSKIECANGKEASWIESESAVKISAIMGDVACKIIFTKKELKIDVRVRDGIGSTTERALYGDPVSLVVEPKSGYGNPSIVCTNNQTATWENNKMTIEALTDNTVCTVYFNKTAVVTHTFKITNPNEFSNISIISGDVTQKIADGESAIIILQSNNEKIPVLNCGGQIADKTIEGNNYKFSFIMKSDVSCKIELE